MLRIASVAAFGLVLSICGAGSAIAQGTVPCAREGGFCNVPYPTTVIYGYRGATTTREVGPGGIPCNNQMFGDPAPGAGKWCSFVARGDVGERDPGYRDSERGGPYGRGPSDYDRRAGREWQTCAEEHQFCEFGGTRRVRYGAFGRFVEGTFHDGVDCSNRQFGDPAPGAGKICQVLE